MGSRHVNQFYFNFGTNQPTGSSVPEKMGDVSGVQEMGTAGTRYSWRKIIALVLVSVGTSIIGAGVILRITRKRNNLQESLEKAGVLFVGDRNAFDEVIGWDNWINETHRCSDLIIIGKDQIKWAEESAEALSRVLLRDIDVSFIFQGEQCDDSLQKFWNEVKQKDPGGRFFEWRKRDKLKLLTNREQDGNYGYYWNGAKLIVKLYFEVERKIQAPLIVFDVRFASGKFDHADFSAGTREHVPFWEKKRMLLQAGLNIWKIQKDSKLVKLEA